MADNVKELYPDFPIQEIDQYKVIVWTFKVNSTRAYIRKVTYEYHINTPWETVYPDERGGALFSHQWCIRHNDNRHYTGRMDEGWNRIFDTKYPMFATEIEAKQGAIEKLTINMTRYQELAEECAKSIRATEKFYFPKIVVNWERACDRIVTARLTSI